MSPSDLRRCEQLINRHFDDGLAASEQQQLAALLSESSEARDLFAQYMRIEGTIAGLSIAGCLDDSIQIATANTNSGEDQPTQYALSENVSFSSDIWKSRAATWMAVSALSRRQPV